MKSKHFVIISVLILLILFCITSCQVINNQKRTTINIKLDLSKLIKSSRNEIATRTTNSTNFILKIFAYDASTYKENSEIETLPLLTQSENKVDINGTVKASLDVEIDLNVIILAALHEGESEQPLYTGVSEVFTVKEKDNKVHINLSKMQTGVFYVDSSNGNDDNRGLQKQPLKTVQRAVDLAIEENDGSNEFIIYLMNDILNEEDLLDNNNALININPDKNLNLKICAENEIPITINANFKSRVLYIGPNANLTIENLILTCGSSENGGAVHISGGKFYMNGGEICSNTATLGGGVYVAENGTFIMNDGIIGSEIGESSEEKSSWEYAATDLSYSNYASSKGGGIHVELGTATINGGKISFNYVPNPDSAGNSSMSLGGGGGINVEKGTLTLNGTEVSYNSGYHGAGVRCYSSDGSDAGELILNNALIKGNAGRTTNWSCFGSGVMVNNFTLICEGTESIIEENFSGDGGALFLEKTTSNLENITIKNNEYDSNGYESGSEVLLYGATNISIFNNVEISNANNLDRGIYLAGGTTDKLNLSGDVCLKTPVFLGYHSENGQSSLQISGALSAETVATITLESYTAGTKILNVEDTSLVIADYVDKFKLSDSSFGIDSDGKICQI